MLESLAMILLVAGIVMIIIEVFIPGFGVFGIGGIIAVITGIIMMANSLQQAAFFILITVVLVTIFISIVIKLLINRKIKTPLILYDSVDEVTSDMTYFIGKNGIALTDLRPAGKGNLDGVTLDMMSDGMFIKKGKPIEVIKINGNKIIVKEISK